MHLMSIGQMFWQGYFLKLTLLNPPLCLYLKAYGAHVVCCSLFIPLCVCWIWTKRIFWDSFEMKLPDWALVPQSQSVCLLDQLWCSPLWRGRPRMCNLYSEKPGPPGWLLLKRRQMAARPVNIRGILMWVNNEIRNLCESMSWTQKHRISVVSQ